MNKKKLIDSYFNDGEKPKIPKASTNKTQIKDSEIKSDVKKTYKKHKIYDSPAEEQYVTAETNEYIITVPTSEVYKADYKVDRLEMTDSSVAELAMRMKDVGQLQPCTVRLKENSHGQRYELIFGERRYRAAMLAKLPLKVVIRNITDNEAALQLVIENNDREDNTDSELGLQLAEFQNRETLTQSDMVTRLGFSKQKISKLLSFEKISPELKQAFGSLRNISATTSEYIVNSSKEPLHLEFFITIADKIASGSYGHTKIRVALEKYKQNIKKELEKSYEKFYANNGTWAMYSERRDNNNNVSLNMVKPMTQFLDKVRETDKEAYTELHSRICETIAKFHEEINMKQS